MKGIRTKEVNLFWLALVMALFLNLPAAFALEISDVQSAAGHTGATVTWETDETATSFIEYGQMPTTLRRMGDAQEVFDHSFVLTDLPASTKYFYKVESSGVVDDNEGQLYSFTTLDPDTEAPDLFVELPETIQGTRVDISGKSEVGTAIKLLVQGSIAGSTITRPGDEGGVFNFNGVALEPDVNNEIKITSTDSFGNFKDFTGQVFADSGPATISLDEIPEIIEEEEFTISGTTSEETTIEIFLNGESADTSEGTVFEFELRLNEGENIVKISAIDAAGWEAIEEITLNSDTEPPNVEFELVGGTEYYENAAETDIIGTTEPGSLVYLFVYRTALQTPPKFERAIAETIADETGGFTFEEVSFPPPLFSNLEMLGPKEVPPGLEEIVTSPLSQLANEQVKGYKIYVIAEDKTGKSNFAEQLVNVNSCSSGDFTFDVTPLVQYQAPFRLDPQLLEEGRESIQAVFNLSYRGNALGSVDPATNQVQAPYRISSVQFQRACTQASAKSDEYEAGCRLLPANLRAQPNHDNTAYFVTGNLQRAGDWVDPEEDYWERFKDGHLKLPIKILIKYVERDNSVSAISNPYSQNNQAPTQAWSSTKSQAFCYDLAYFVDIQIDSSDMVPDFLANEGVDALNETITFLEDIRPYMETVMLATGWGCMGSFLSKMAARLYRFFMSGFEPWLTRANADGEKCPALAAQNKLYLADTITDWNALRGHPDANFPPEMAKLEDKCPNTATAWELEALVDQAYRWTCDRFLCREVPARWTEEAEEHQVREVVLSQQQCSATSNGIPLEKIENCQDFVERNKVGTAPLLSKAPPVCYRSGDTVYYIHPDDNKDPILSSKGVKVLRPIDEVLAINSPIRSKLFAYNVGGDALIVGTDQSCNTYCQSKPGYLPVDDGYAPVSVTSGRIGLERTNRPAVANPTGTPVSTSVCYKETPKEAGVINFLEGNDIALTGPGGKRIDGTKYAAGYTRDCFLEEGTGDLYQCVCQKQEQKPIIKEGARVAIKKVGELEEPWEYRQDAVYRESGGFQGTQYPSWRYYGGRDLSGAFGFNFGLDNFKSGIGEMSTTTINPSTQTVGAFQSVCVTQINARLEMLRSILTGIRNCILEAKFTGLHDAGMCKTIFTQYVCGLIYKGISLLVNDCSPLPFKDVGKGIEDPTDGGIEAFFDAGAAAVPAAIGSSIDEVKSDYGNAKLNQFFSSGTEGFAESMCLFAFGYDFPMGTDFILDAAYSVPMASSVFFPIANRELSTFDPIKGTATFNYKLAGTILPGCNIRGYKTYLKCIGPEDQGHPNVECQNDGCDCLRASSSAAQLAGQRTFQVEGGSQFGGLTKSQMHDIPIPSPQKISSNFRYDHVVVELTLDQGESPETCFDEGYRTSNGGIFYSPITPIEVPASVACFVDGDSGRFICPEVKTFFGGGSTYLEHPFIQCYDKSTGNYENCETPNLFLLGDEITIKPKVYLGDDGACLKVSDSRNLIQPRFVQLPAGTPGPFSPVVSLATVTDEMVTGTGVGTIVPVDASSDQGCGGHGAGQVEVITRPGPGTSATGELRFAYRTLGGNQYEVTIPGNAQVDQVSVNAGYGTLNNLLAKNGVTSLSGEQINAAIFASSGFRFTKVFGQPNPGTNPKNACTYQMVSSGVSGGLGGLTVTVELLQKPQSGNCFEATQRLPGNTLGKPFQRQRIQVQAEPVEVQYAGGMHQDFRAGNYNLATQKAQGVINRQEATIDDALALYYVVAGLVLSDAQAAQVGPQLDLFFNRGYGENVKLSPDYQKINMYMCQVDTAFGTGKSVGQCGLAGTPAAGSSLCADYPTTVSGDANYKYKCVNQEGSSGTVDACNKATGDETLGVAVTDAKVKLFEACGWVS